jgi:hypothetical protein
VLVLRVERGDLSCSLDLGSFVVALLAERRQQDDSVVLGEAVGDRLAVGPSENLSSNNPSPRLRECGIRAVWPNEASRSMARVALFWSASSRPASQSVTSARSTISTTITS